MTHEPSDRGSYRWLGITLLVTAGVYAWYAIDQFGRLNDLNQRQLSNAVAELKTALETALENVSQFDRKWRSWKSAAGDRPEVCEFARSQPYLELDACAASSPSSADGWRTLKATSSPTLGIEARDGSERSVFFRFRADRLLQELAFPDSFGLIVVATGEGVILYQDAPTRRGWLRHLRWSEQTYRDASADRPPTLQIQNLRDVLGAADSWNQLRSVSSRTNVQLGGMAHQLYLQPLTIERGERVNLIVGGAVPTRLLVRDALALEADLLGLLVFLLLVGLTGFPFVKLASLDLHERFRLRDVTLLYLSTGALLVVFTCGFLALDGYVRWQTVADGGLAPFAQRLETLFLTEVETIRDQLEHYDRQVIASTRAAEDKRKISASDCERWLVQTQWFRTEPKANPNSALPDVWLPWPDKAIHLRQVAWIRPDGQQIWKSTADMIPGKTPVGQRVYFRAVRDGHLLQVRGRGPAFFLGPDRSISDGRFYTFISMKSGVPPALCADPADSTKPDEGVPVVTATAHLLSLDRQPLPAGYGFGLVTRDGRVLYHSDRRLSLRENLFEELSEGTRARAMMYAGWHGALSSRYRERAHHFYLQPVALTRVGEQEPAGIYLAAFRDISVERALVGRVFIGGLIGPMLLLLAFFRFGLWGIAVASRCVDDRWSAWLWPHGGLHRVYRRQTFAFLALLVASVAFYMITGSVAPFLLIPVLAVIVGIGIYVHGKRQPVPRSWLAAPFWHTAALLLVLVCMIIAPSAAVFRLALKHEFADLIWTERAWIEAQKADVVRAAEVEALGDNYAPSGSTRRVADRRNYFICIPPPYGATSPEEREANRSIAACEPGPRRSPSRDPDRSATLYRVNALDRWVIRGLRWLDTVLPFETEALARQSFQDADFTYSPDVRLMGPLRASAVAWIGLGLTLWLLVLWIRWNTNRLFYANKDTTTSATPSAPPDEVWKDRSDDERMVLLQVARERIANPYQQEWIKQLLDDGVLRLEPDLRPYSAQFENFVKLKTNDPELHTQLLKWEHVNVGHSWRYVRLIVIGLVAGLGVFLTVTQPALQSSLLGIAVALTAALTTALKLRDAITSWLATRKSPAS